MMKNGRDTSLMRYDHNVTILSIDDDASIRHSITAYLEDYNFHVIGAENGRIGLEIFRSENPDLILLDLRMPKLTG